jgi:hypothetical protein
LEPEPTPAPPKKQKASKEKKKELVRDRKPAVGAHLLGTAHTEASNKVKLLLNKVPIPPSEIIRPGKRTMSLIINRTPLSGWSSEN